MTILQLLASGSFITFNKEIARKYGIEEAVLLGAMCSYQISFDNNEFYKEQDKILYDTALTLYSLRKATKTLQDVGILEIIKKGIPAKNYYKINENVLLSIVTTRAIENDSTRECENNTTSNSENDSTIINNNTKTNNTINNKSIREKQKEELKSLFINFCNENNIPDEMKNSILLWLKYKKEKKQKYTETGLKTLLTRLLKDYQSNGKDYVVNAINNSICQNYSGIFADNKTKKVDAFDEILNASIKGE